MPRQFLGDVARPNVAEFHEQFDSVGRTYNAL